MDDKLIFGILFGAIQVFVVLYVKFTRDRINDIEKKTDKAIEDANAKITSLAIQIAHLHINEDSLRDVNKELRYLSSVVFQIAGKMGIQTKEA